MTTKTLTITEDAYERFAKHKGKHESFSDVIVKNFPKHSLLELGGIFTPEEVSALRQRVTENRKLSRERMQRIAKRVQ